MSNPWAPYDASEAAPWNRRRVIHLHRRAGFAATWEEQERDLTEGPRSAVDRLLQGAAPSPNRDEFEAMARTIGDAAMASSNPTRLKAWWVYRMLFSPDPLGERLTLMWHNHFATSNRKVQDLVLMREQNELFRTHARQPFGELLRAVIKHPAMLVWLDADANHKGQPNENLARETLELFTLGVGHYTETDVQEAARALTGWAVVGGQFGFRESRHDTGTKSLFEKTGELNGDDLLTAALEHPATAKRIAWRICRTFLGDTVVGEAESTDLADELRQRNLDTKWAVETVLRSKLFFSEAAIRQRIAGPAEWTVGTLRTLEQSDPSPSTLLLAEWIARMGQDLFYPPNVGGWSEGRAWLSSQSIVARANFAASLLNGRLRHPTKAPDIGELARRHHNTKNDQEAVAWIMELLSGAARLDIVSEVVAAAATGNEESSLSTAIALLLARPESQLS